jgi:hypothetical protein
MRREGGKSEEERSEGKAQIIDCKRVMRMN